MLTDGLKDERFWTAELSSSAPLRLTRKTERLKDCSSNLRVATTCRIARERLKALNNLQDCSKSATKRKTERGVERLRLLSPVASRSAGSRLTGYGC